MIAKQAYSAFAEILTNPSFRGSSIQFLEGSSMDWNRDGSSEARACS
jgi:hypothetical protein